FGPRGRFLHLVAVKIGEDQIDVLAVSHGAIRRHRSDCGAVIGLVAKAVIVELCDRRLYHLRRPELIKPRSRSLRHSRWDVFPPGLVGRDAQRLSRLDYLGAILDEALPALPGELVVVADAHEREMRARVLDVGIADVGLIDHAVTSERGRDMKIAHLA